MSEINNNLNLTEISFEDLIHYLTKKYRLSIDTINDDYGLVHISSYKDIDSETIKNNISYYRDEENYYVVFKTLGEYRIALNIDRNLENRGDFTYNNCIIILDKDLNLLIDYKTVNEHHSYLVYLGCLDDIISHTMIECEVDDEDFPEYLDTTNKILSKKIIPSIKDNSSKNIKTSEEFKIGECSLNKGIFIDSFYNHFINNNNPNCKIFGIEKNDLDYLFGNMDSRNLDSMYYNSDKYNPNYVDTLNTLKHIFVHFYENDIKGNYYRNTIDYDNVEFMISLNETILNKYEFRFSINKKLYNYFNLIHTGISVYLNGVEVLDSINLSKLLIENKLTIPIKESKIVELFTSIVNDSKMIKLIDDNLNKGIVYDNIEIANINDINVQLIELYKNRLKPSKIIPITSPKDVELDEFNNGYDRYLNDIKEYFYNKYDTIIHKLEFYSFVLVESIYNKYRFSFDLKLYENEGYQYKSISSLSAQDIEVKVYDEYMNLVGNLNHMNWKSNVNDMTIVSLVSIISNNDIIERLHNDFIGKYGENINILNQFIEDKNKSI